jgi:hypothetical protein
MAFIRKRISPSRRKTPSYQLIETYREDGKVKQRVLANLGRHSTPERAMKEYGTQLDEIRQQIGELEASRPSESGNSSRKSHDRKLQGLQKLYARQLREAKKLEAAVSSLPELNLGTETMTSLKHWIGERKSDNSEGIGFLEWLIRRNREGWSYNGSADPEADRVRPGW